MHHCNQPPFAEKATICKSIVYLLASAAIMDCSNILKLGREFALDGLLLPRLPTGRGGWRAPWAAELPTMLQAPTGCSSTRREPAVLWVRPSLGHWPVADSHARS